LLFGDEPLPVIVEVFAGAGGGVGAAAGGDAGAVPLCFTPPWCEHAPLPLVFDIVPSVHITGAPDAMFGGLAGAGAGRGAGAGGCAAAVGVAGVPTPPWCEHAPLPLFDCVPSLQLTIVAGGGGGAGGVCAAFVFALSTPPCPEQAPDPVAFEVVPSTQTLAGPCARSEAGSAITAASAARLISRLNKGTSSIVEELYRNRADIIVPSRED
jgi:hypothetical protein